VQWVSNLALRVWCSIRDSSERDMDMTRTIFHRRLISGPVACSHQTGAAYNRRSGIGERGLNKTITSEKEFKMQGLKDLKMARPSKESESSRLQGHLRFALSVLFVVLLLPISSQTTEQLGQFTAKLIDNGTMQKTFFNPAIAVIQSHKILRGAALRVKGIFAEFDLDLDTFTVSNYTLKDASTGSLSPQSTLFLTEVPEPKQTLVGDVHIRLVGPNLVVERGTGEKSKKIVAYDRPTGGVFLSIGSPPRGTLRQGGPTG